MFGISSILYEIRSLQFELQQSGSGRAPQPINTNWPHKSKKENKPKPTPKFRCQTAREYAWAIGHRCGALHRLAHAIRSRQTYHQNVANPRVVQMCAEDGSQRKANTNETCCSQSHTAKPGPACTKCEWTLDVPSLTTSRRAEQILKLMCEHLTLTLNADTGYKLVLPIIILKCQAPEYAFHVNHCRRKGSFQKGERRL